MSSQDNRRVTRSMTKNNQVAHTRITTPAPILTVQQKVRSHKSKKQTIKQKPSKKNATKSLDSQSKPIKINTIARNIAHDPIKSQVIYVNKCDLEAYTIENSITRDKWFPTVMQVNLLGDAFDSYLPAFKNINERFQFINNNYAIAPKGYYWRHESYGGAGYTFDDCTLEELPAMPLNMSGAYASFDSYFPTVKCVNNNYAIAPKGYYWRHESYGGAGYTFDDYTLEPMPAICNFN